ncbi:sulfite exporter TauE/SafE family protein [Psychromarinibacter sp. C21-152]|uniref:Probable membrane transporter protein n=1 Tax=Psychromarinibacter sediminicola TaxID=3033385 RepID=A0AAE3NS47_9RHOB|nr:sulfite exporter TauE/SafE family protein [Psychromarinibacter sediminicola]MDF0602518.1 sulfite exporter TauE/SafE family protein [Psychromarinibacter sediminicola]
MPETALLIQLALILIAIGAFAGVLAGLLGVGGGIVLVAAFFYSFTALGYLGPQLMQICLATSLATIVVTSVRSVHGHNKKGAVDWTVLKTWAPGIAVGAVVGVLVAASLRTVALQAIFGVLAIVISLYMAFGRRDWRLGAAMPTGAARAALSPAVGFLSVLMGIGGGSFGVPVMTLYGMPIHRAVATAAGFGLLIAVPSVIGFLFVEIDPAFRPPFTVGAINLPAFAIVISMTLLTTPLGVKLAHRLDPAPLRRVFAVFLFLVALNMLRAALFG